jgi:hypothetical protein
MLLPPSYRTESIDRQHPNTVAIMRGPVMYVGCAQTPSATATPPSEKTPAVATGYSLLPFYEVDKEEYKTYFTPA